MPVGSQSALHEKRGFFVGLVQRDFPTGYMYGGGLGLAVYIYQVL